MPLVAFTVYGPEQGYFVPFVHDFRTLAYAIGCVGTIEAPDGPADTPYLLERIFARGNGRGSDPGFTVGRRSMSAGDVVHLEGLGVWVCDIDGWTAVEGADATRFPLARSA